MSSELHSQPLVAVVQLTPIGPGANGLRPGGTTTVHLDHQANEEVCAAVRRMIERQHDAPAGDRESDVHSHIELATAQRSVGFQAPDQEDRT